MLVGYARTSTVEQEAGLAAQERDLKAAGCQKVFAERVSSVARRDKLQAALDYVRDGDTLFVTKPDRLARSTADLLAIVERLEGKGVGLVVLSMGGQRIDTHRYRQADADDARRDCTPRSSGRLQHGFTAVLQPTCPGHRQAGIPSCRTWHSAAAARAAAYPRAQQQIELRRMAAVCAPGTDGMVGARVVRGVG